MDGCSLCGRKSWLMTSRLLHRKALQQQAKIRTATAQKTHHGAMTANQQGTAVDQ
jgi:hypothetical protein